MEREPCRHFALIAAAQSRQGDMRRETAGFGRETELSHQPLMFGLKLGKIAGRRDFGDQRMRPPAAKGGESVNADIDRPDTWANAFFDDPNSIKNFRDDIENIRIYPNPCSDVIQIELNDDIRDISRARIADYTGNIIRSRFVPVKNADNQYIISTKNLIPGYYLLELFSGRETIVRRFIIER